MTWRIKYSCLASPFELEPLFISLFLFHLILISQIWIFSWGSADFWRSIWPNLLPGLTSGRKAVDLNKTWTGRELRFYRKSPTPKIHVRSPSPEQCRSMVEQHLTEPLLDPAIGRFAVKIWLTLLSFDFRAQLFFIILSLLTNHHRNGFVLAVVLGYLREDLFNLRNCLLLCSILASLLRAVVRRGLSACTYLHNPGNNLLRYVVQLLLEIWFVVINWFVLSRVHFGSWWQIGSYLRVWLRISHFSY